MPHSIPRKYKGIQMRSGLETRVAAVFDALKIEWQYEPDTYDLGAEGWYLPDFFLPKLKTVVEVKGDMYDASLTKPHTLSRLIHVEDEWWDPDAVVVILGSGWMRTLSWDLRNANTTGGGSEIPDFFVLQDGECRDAKMSQCSVCSNYWFYNGTGSFACRFCKEHDGDHNVGVTIGGTYCPKCARENTIRRIRWAAEEARAKK